MEYLTRARREGIERPMEILLSMDPERRRLLAQHLDLDRATENMDAEREAWTLLVRARKGIRARSHTFFERINPFIRCVTWEEVLQRTARYYGIEEEAGVRELERSIFEHFSSQVVESLDPEEVSFLDALMVGDLRTKELLAREALSVNGVRMLVGSCYRFAVHELVSLWGGSARFASKLHSPRFWCRPPFRLWVKRGMLSGLMRLCRIPLLRRLLQRPIEFVVTMVFTHPVRVVPVIMALYLFDSLGSRALSLSPK